MFPNEGGQKHLVRDLKCQWGNKEKDGYKVGSEKDSCVNCDRQITEKRRKQRLEWDRRYFKRLQKRIPVFTYLSTSSLMGFLSLLGQSKFEGLTFFRNVNHEEVHTVLVTVAN